MDGKTESPQLCWRALVEGAGAGAAACGITGGKKHHMELLVGGKGKLQNKGNCIPLASCCLFLTLLIDS